MPKPLTEIRSVRDFCDDLRKRAEQGQLADALDNIAHLVIDVMSRESSWAAVFSSPDLDRLCLELGRMIPRRPIAPPDRDRTVFLVTALAPVGGHTRVLMDLIQADPGKDVTVLVTNVRHQLRQKDIDELLGTLGVEIELAPDENLALTLAWLQRRLSELSPARTYNLQHHFDPTIVAAGRPELVGQLFYFHHCDHNLALGLHIPHAVHVDFNAKGFHHCRSVKGITDNVYWPLVADVAEHRASASFITSGQITTATSGNFNKFDTSWLLERTPYLYDYKALLPLIMGRTGGTHIHIGPLKPEVIEDITKRLDAAGLDRENFIYVPWVRDVAAELVRRKVDLYIGSFPLGGGRALIEAMGAGVPLLLHENYASGFFTDVGEAYPGVMSWRHPDELTAILQHLTADRLADHAQRARRHYETHHTPERLKQALAATLDGRSWAAPEAPIHHPDLLQRYLDRWADGGRAVKEGPTALVPEPIETLTLATIASRNIRTQHLVKILLRRLWLRTGLSRLSFSRGAVRSCVKRILSSRAVLFATLLVLGAAHAVRRGRVDSIIRSEHAARPLKFMRLVAKRYREGLGANVLLWRQTYLTQENGYFVSPHHIQLTRALRLCLQIFLANVLKAQGFFADAEHLYKTTLQSPVTRSLGLVGLGDLLLLHAKWENEFSAYEADDIALNPFSRFQPPARVLTWHDHTLSEATNYLKQATIADPRSPDAWWLLSCAFTEAAAWHDALAALRRFAGLNSPTALYMFAKARAEFSIGSTRGVSAYKEALGEQVRSWRVDEAVVVSATELKNDERLQCRQTGQQTSISVSSKVIKDNQILEFSGTLEFAAPFVAQYDSAELLPNFSMVLANGRCLISESLHLKPCHWSYFCPPVKALTEDRAIICREHPTTFTEPGCIFIGFNRNYYHWLVDEIPRLMTIQGASEYCNAPILIDYRYAPWQRDILERCGVDQSRFRTVDPDRPMTFKRLIVPSHLSRNMVAHPAAVHYTRHVLAPHADRASPTPGKRLYMRRSAHSVRKSALLNERCVIEKFKRANFTFVDTGEMTLDEQIEMFADAEVIAGAGGAAFANALFAPKGAKLLVLSPSDCICETFSSIANAIGQEGWCCAGVSYARPYQAWVWTQFDFEIAPKDIDLCFEHVL